jgi:tRNA (guanine-N7-)-methyltransferase
MRFRKLKNLDTRRDNCSELRIPYSIPDFDLRNIDNVRAYIDFSECFENDAPLVLEIGCGKGQFATEYAKRNPDKNVVGIECVPGVLVIACEKAKEAKVSNLRFLEMKAEYLPVFIKEKSVSEIFLNFSTPFPKARHEKHRLTSPEFLSIYKKILVPGGVIAQKTDSLDFFEYSIESFINNGFEVTSIIKDLHNSGFEGNIVTEYEQKFAQQGLPLYRLEAKLKD